MSRKQLLSLSAISAACAMLMALQQPIFAQEAVLAASDQQSATCDRLELARELARKNNSKWVLDCYWGLSDVAKRDLFPEIIREAGVSLETLTQDFQLMTTTDTLRPMEAIPLWYQPNIARSTPGGPSTNLTSGSGAWTDWLERVPFSAVFAPLVSAGGIWRDQYWCDGTFDPDLDAILVDHFPSAVSDYLAVRSFGTLEYPLVDAMLTYYGFGVNGSGYTWSSTVYACVGETAVNWLGEGYIYNGLKLHR